MLEEKRSFHDFQKVIPNSANLSFLLFKKNRVSTKLALIRLHQKIIGVFNFQQEMALVIQIRFFINAYLLARENAIISSRPDFQVF